MRKLSAALLIVFLSSSAPVLCKSSSNKQVDKKHSLVDQIIETVQEESKMSDDELAALKEKQKERMSRVVDAIADKEKLSDEDRARLKEKLAARKADQHKMPPELKEKFEQRFDFKNFSKQTTYQVLNDHLDDSDLKAILKFLKSSTGQKLFHEGPDMVLQMIELSAEKYVPVIIDLAREMKLRPDQLLGPREHESGRKREMLEKIRQLMKDRLPPRPPSESGKDET